jgi:hypothetical protein
MDAPNKRILSAMPGGVAKSIELTGFFLPSGTLAD